jgi:hypothetical protein
MPYYADARKHLLHANTSIARFSTDKANGQLVHIFDTVFGVSVRPSKQWTAFCERVFRREKANGIWLDDISIAPKSSLAFINDISDCKRLTVEQGEKVNLSPLAGSSCLAELQIGADAHVASFDLASIPKLRRLQIPVHKELMSFLKCTNLISLVLNGGQHDGILGLQSLRTIEELLCFNVRKLEGLELNSKTRLRSLELVNLKSFTSICPPEAFTKDLRVVELSKTPKLKIEWLAQAHNLECIALRLGKIPSIKFLDGLKRLQVLDLFGSKVEDGDLSFRDSLKGEMDAKLWGAEKP